MYEEAHDSSHSATVNGGPEIPACSALSLQTACPGMAASVAMGPLLSVAMGVLESTARSLTVYHVNPLHEGVIPVDMDTADIAGDAFFDLRSKVRPLECAHNNSYSGDCTNQEVVDGDLVVTKLTLTLQQSGFGPYGRCNICGPNGVDPFSGLNCTADAYICSCGDYWNPKDCSTQRKVGAEDIGKAFGHRNYGCTWQRWIKEPWVSSPSKSSLPTARAHAHVMRYKLLHPRHSSLPSSRCAGDGVLCARQAACGIQPRELAGAVRQTQTQRRALGTPSWKKS